jgi:hypothetical protein
MSMAEYAVNLPPQTDAMTQVVLHLLDIVKFALPAGILAFVMQKMFAQYMEAKNRQTIMELRTKGKFDTLPTRLQAYERLLLFMERSEPSNLILRLHRPGMSAALLQAEMLRSIREEYEHNLTQQLYVSPVAWKRVLEGKDAVLQLIQVSFARMGNTSTGLDLSNVMFEIIAKSGASPTLSAVETLKQEASELL